MILVNASPALQGGGMYCPISSGRLTCIQGGEGNGQPAQTLTVGQDYRFRFQHDYAGQTATMTVWSGNCTLVGSQQEPLTNPQPLTAGTWTLGPSIRWSFLRLYTGLNTSGACPLDAPAAPADLFDFTFENNTGSAGSLVDRSGHGYNITASGSSFATSAVYPPLASIAGWTTPKPVFRAGQPLSLNALGAECFTYPGTGACSTYLWIAIAGPQLTGMTPQTGVIATFTPPVAGQYTFQLTVTDNTKVSASSTQSVGAVATDANFIVTIPNVNFLYALGNLLMHGQSPWPWFEATEAADVDLMSAPFAAAVNEVAGPGTVTIPSCTPVTPPGPCTGTLNNVSSAGQIQGNTYGNVAIKGSGTNFSSADLGTEIEITWDPDGNGSYLGHFVTNVGAVDVANQVITTQFPFLLEFPASFATALSWHRLNVGSGTCSGCAATVSGGQVTAISTTGSSGYHWWALSPTPAVTFSGGGGSGCNGVSANVTTAGAISGYNGLPCGSGYTSAPTVTITPYNDWSPYNVNDGNSFIFNFYEACLAVGRFWQRTQLTTYQTEFHNCVTQIWRWGLDSGYSYGTPRNLGLDAIVAGAVDPSWTPPGGANNIFAGLARIIQASAGGATIPAGGSTPTYNPTTNIVQASIDPREVSYITRFSAKLAHLGGQYGLSGATWCGYLAAQNTYIWQIDAATPVGDTTGAKFFPENIFANNFGYPDAGHPPVSGPFGTSPWRDAGLPAIALSDAYTALNDPATCNNPTAASTLYNSSGTGLLTALMNFAWNYGRAPDGGTFYAGGYESNAVIQANLLWNDYAPPANYVEGASISVTNGSPTVIGSTGGSPTHFLRQFGAGAQMQILGTNYTVSAVTNDYTLTLATNYSGATASNIGNFGNTCSITVTVGSATVNGSSGCQFTNFFSGGGYIGIVVENGGSDNNVYGLTVNSDTQITLNTPFVSAVTCLPTCPNVRSFVYAPASLSGILFCGANSLFTYCNPDQYNGRNLTEDVCYVYAWLYQQTSNTTWKSYTNQCYNKIYGGAPGGSGANGPPAGASVYARPGTLTATSGSPAISGVGTLFTEQFTNGGQITIADGTGSGNTWASPPGLNPTFYTLTVLAVNSDTSITLAGNYPGTGSTGTGMFYNPADPQWLGADGGAGNLGETLPVCGANAPPCGIGNFVPKYGKPLGMGSGAGNAPLAFGMIANPPPLCRPPLFRIGVCEPSSPLK